MGLPSGTYELGPDHAQLTVLTAVAGPAARLGHALRITVSSWDAVLTLSPQPAEGSLTLKADAGSLMVAGGDGGLQRLSEADGQKIRSAIDGSVLKRSTVRFNSTRVGAQADTLAVDGELTLLGTCRPLSFTVAIAADGSFSAAAQLQQSVWGIRPYAVMRGALKVADLVTVTADGALPPPISAGAA